MVSRAVSQPFQAVCVEALDPGPDRRFVALEDDRNLGDGVAPTGEQDHADALTHPAHFAPHQPLQVSSLRFVERSHKDHRGCSRLAPGAYALDPTTPKNYWNVT